MDLKLQRQSQQGLFAIDADQSQERQGILIRTEQDVLAVVQRFTLPAYAPCTATKMRAGFKQGHTLALRGQSCRGGETGAATADDGDMVAVGRIQARSHVSHASQSLRSGVSEVREFSTC